MILTDNEIKDLIHGSIKRMSDTNLAIIYNALGFTNRINKNHEMTDFFSNEEIGEIFDSLILNGVTVLPYPNELDFIQDIIENNLKLNNLVVWNLSRQGSENNQKSLVTSLCDFKGIPYIGSSVYSMNLARNKLHFQKMLKAEGLADIPTFSVKEFLKTKFLETDYFILKKKSGSASRGLLSETTNISYPRLKEYLTKHSHTDNMIIQEFVSGYEIEVPLFQINGEFKALGLAGISVNNSNYLYDEIIPEETFEFQSQCNFFNYSNFATKVLNYNNIEYIYDTAIHIANLFELKDYCRIDFRVDSNGNIYCFDISTTPYVTHHSSPNFLLKERSFTHKNLLALVFSAFNSNVGNH